jgi:hypothetical protein
MRFADAWLPARPLHEPIPFEADQMDAHGVIGQMQSGGEVVDGAGGAAEEGKNLPARAVEESFPEGLAFHGTGRLRAKPKSSTK